MSLAQIWCRWGKINSALVVFYTHFTYVEKFVLQEFEKKSLLAQWRKKIFVVCDLSRTTGLVWKPIYNELNISSNWVVVINNSIEKLDITIPSVSGDRQITLRRVLRAQNLLWSIFRYCELFYNLHLFGRLAFVSIALYAL